MRMMAFRRDFQGYSGGHGKVWDYFRHVAAHQAWDAQIHFEPGSIDEGNPWREAGVAEVPDWRSAKPDAYFLAGMDWQAHPVDDPARPVLNLIQGLRHADPEHALHAFLSRPAIRICVGRSIADAINATGRARGPVHVIDAGLQLPEGLDHAAPGHGVFIAGNKQQHLANTIAGTLRDAGLSVELALDWLPRDEFLRRMAAAKIVVALPLEQEGFFLPALESMALGRATVVPDCTGNRAYLEPGANALVPDLSVNAIVAAVQELHGDRVLCDRLATQGHATSLRFGLERERDALHALLDDIDVLWKDAWTATLH